jgi:hypothetical protein
LSQFATHSTTQNSFKMQTRNLKRWQRLYLANWL